MKPIKTIETNVIFGKEQEEYLDYPGHLDKDGEGTPFFACWKLDDKDLENIKKNGGHIYTMNLTFGRPLSPTMLSTESPFVNKENNEG